MTSESLLSQNGLSARAAGDAVLIPLPARGKVLRLAREAIESEAGNLTRAALRLGVHRRTLHRWLVAAPELAALAESRRHEAAAAALARRAS